MMTLLHDVSNADNGGTKQRNNELAADGKHKEYRNSKRYTRYSTRFANRSSGIGYVSEQDSEDHKAPLYHLKGRETRRYTDSQSFTDDSNVFEIKLELFNRRGVRKVKKPLPDKNIAEICDYFFESVGKVKAAAKFCVKCGDANKSRQRFDIYYINLVEISQMRTVYCSDCLTGLLNEQIKGELSDIIDELKLYRILQPDGIYIDPFSISCGR